MQKQLLTTLFPAAILGVAALSAPAQALEKGDVFARVGATGVYPNSDSDAVQTVNGAVPGSSVEVEDAWSLGLTVNYMVTDNIDVELLAAWPFQHDIKSDGTLQSIVPGTIGETKHLPPTLSVDYHFMPKNNIRPYAGVGVNYTYFWDEKVKGSLKQAGYDDLSLDSSWGLALQGGVDFDLVDRWFLNASLRYIWIKTDAKVKEAAPGSGALGPELKIDNVEINPWVVSLMVGTTF